MTIWRALPILVLTGTGFSATVLVLRLGTGWPENPLHDWQGSPRLGDEKRKNKQDEETVHLDKVYADQSLDSRNWQKGYEPVHLQRPGGLARSSD